MVEKKALRCLCGNTGWALWDQREPFSTSDGFYLRVRLALDGPPQVVCLECGEIQAQAILGIRSGLKEVETIEEIAATTSGK